MLVNNFIVLGLISFGFGCATVPDDAPQEFFDAEASIEKMGDNDVDEYFPNTVERAHNSFDQALDLLEDSREGETGATRTKAIAKASEAKETAEGANKLHSTVRFWDQSQSTLQDALAMLNNMDLQSVEVVENVAHVSPFAKLRNTEFVSTVAYFDTNKTDPTFNDIEVEALVRILEKDSNFQVILTGHADRRGDSTHNQKLALKRAQKIASDLENRGVLSSQMIVESVGENNAKGGANNIARLQLDRRVQAKVIVQ